jgi:hypothetical protein
MSGSAPNKWQYQKNHYNKKVTAKPSDVVCTSAVALSWVSLSSDCRLTGATSARGWSWVPTEEVPQRNQAVPDCQVRRGRDLPDCSPAVHKEPTCRFAQGVPRLLDLCCGRGGDLHKWKDVNVGRTARLSVRPLRCLR